MESPSAESAIIVPKKLEWAGLVKVSLLAIMVATCRHIGGHCDQSHSSLGVPLAQGTAEGAAAAVTVAPAW